MRAKTFVILFFSFLILFLFTYVGLFFFQLQAPVGADYWVKNACTFKEARSKSITVPKVIILGGSNVLFGISTEVLERELRRPVLNLGLHAGLDIDYLYYELEKNMSEGDIVILSLEYQYYYTTEQLTTLFVNNMMAWGTEYIKQLSLKRKLDFIVTADPERVVAGVLKKLQEKGNKNIKSIAELQSSLEDEWKNGTTQWRGYSYKSMNKFGDINVDEISDVPTRTAYLTNDGNLSQYFLENYRNIYELVKKHNGQLLLVHPVTLKGDELDFSKRKSREKIKVFENMLLDYNITLYCEPSISNLERRFFFNTAYHPNINGAKLRSYALSKCLKQELLENINNMLK